MKSLLILSFFGISHAFKPANRAELKTAVDACVDGASGIVGTKDGSECYACLNGDMKTSAVACDAGDTAQFITDWDTSLVTDMTDLFNHKTKFNQALNWDTSSVTSFWGTFKKTDFNQDISSWDVSKGTKFINTFSGSKFNQDISSWDMSSATTFAYMFFDSDFNQDISGWDTSSVTNMEHAFMQTPFDQDISCWDISSLSTGANGYEGMRRMFKESSMSKTLCWAQTVGDHEMFKDAGGGSVDTTCTPGCTADGATCSADSECRSGACSTTCQPRCKENEHVSSGTCTACAAGKVRIVRDDPAGADTECETPRFKPANRAELKTAVDACVDGTKDGSECYACSDGTMKTSASASCSDTSTPTFITDWDTSLVTDMNEIFYNKENFNQALNWDTSSVTNMYQMFRGTTNFNEDISALDTSKVKKFDYMFLQSGFNQDISSWDVSSGTDFTAMFKNAIAFNQDISAWDMSSAKILYKMFAGLASARNKFNKDISAWDTSSVTKMSFVFEQCEFDQDISCWDVSSVTTFSAIFFNGDMSKTLCWDTGSADVSSAFSNSGGGSFDSTCTPTCSCAENEHASGGSCVACTAGKTNAAGDPKTPDSACDTVLCAEDHHVVNNTCQPCAQGTRPAGDDASGANTACTVGPCGGFTCARGTCVNNECECPVGYSGMTCDKDVTAAGKQMFLESKRKRKPTLQDIRQTQKDIRTFVKDTLNKALLTKTLKQAILDTKITVDKKDLSDRAKIVVLQLQKQPVLAVASANKNEQDTCDQGVNSARCAMFDIKDSPDEIVFLNTDEDAGSWSVLNSGDKILSKQTRVSEDVYDMQCWNNSTWSTKVRFDTSTGADVYECNEHIILIGSQAAVCTDDTCQNGGTCAPDGYSFTCSCTAGYTGTLCEDQDITHCHQIDCSDFGGYKFTECTTCDIATCCNYATRSAFDTHCDTLTATVDYVEAKCCQRTYCI